jgi:catechol 2,3-dioxygenase-like lactoylglutathione lyase family enzyme
VHDGRVTTLDHVALAVRDPARSLAFYRDLLAIDGPVRDESYGFIITTKNGIAFTLFRGEPPPAMGDFHIGVGLPSAAAVRAARTRFRSLQLIEHEWCDEEGYVSVKIRDPDGYIVEVSWDVEDPAT